MSLQNVRNNMQRKLLIAIGLLTATLPVQASVVYNFTSAPISVRALLDLAGNEIQDTGSFRKLPHSADKQKVELSGRILRGGSNEEITIYRKPDCRDSEGSR